MNNSNGLALFTNSINKLMESPLIMVDKQIANLLQTVTRVPNLMKCLQDTVKATSYATEFSRARVTLTRPDGTIESKLKLPADQSRLFTFVVCLLMQIDSDQINFTDFLKEYYYNADSNASYACFVSEVLKPFKNAAESLLHSQELYIVDTEAIERAEKYFYAEKCYLPNEVLNRLLTLVDGIRQSLTTVNFTSQADYSDAVAICNAMYNALYLKNDKILSFVWIGFKNTLRLYDGFAVILDEIANLLQTNLQYD